MPKVTSGHVMFHRVKKDDEYGILRKVEVQLSFEVPQDGADDAHLIRTNEVLGDCVRFVNAALARAPGADLSDAKPAPAAATAATPPANDKAKLEAAAKGEEAPKTRAKKPPAAEAPKAAETTVDPASVEDPTLTPAPAAQAPAPVASPGTASGAEVTDDDLFAAEPAEITEEALLAAITRKNAEIKNAVAIRQLIGKYVPAPGRAQQIDKKLRAKFIEELNALKPAA